MNTKFLSFIILGVGIMISAILIGDALAQTATDIQYPVSELGNCQNEAACRAYCDKPENIRVCVNFAEKHNLMSGEEIEMAKKFIAAGAKGPGGCLGKEACEEYCNNISYIDECVAFAEKNNLMSPKELAEAKKVQAAIKRGVKPPPCGNKKQCDVYCSEPEHIEECITFAEAAGFIPPEELGEARKVLAAVKRGVKAPPCRGKDECDIYCSEPEHMEVCMNFAIEAGFMDERERGESQKVLAAIKKGVKPPPCRGKEQCDVYCAEENHFEECMKFAEAAGFMTPEEAEMARKTGGKGPAGCRSRKECEAFCNNPDNQETCFNFAKEHGMIPEEDLRKMEEGKQRFQESLNQAPPEVLDCLNSSVGTEQMEKFKSGAVMPPREIGDKMRECFEKFGAAPGPLSPQGPGMPGPGSQMNLENLPSEVAQCLKSTLGENIIEQIKSGQLQPGQEINEKVKSCFEQFGPRGPEGKVPGTGMPMPSAPGEFIGGPGGCKTPEECQGSVMGPAGPQAPQPPIMMPPGGQPPAMPPEGQLVPPLEGTPQAPAPSSLLSPQSLMGLIFGILNLGNR